MIGETVDIEINDWILKIRLPASGGTPRVILLLHGWTGDENSMWVFASRLPLDALLVAPRAPHEITSDRYSGHSWVDHLDASWSWLEDYRPSVSALDGLLDALSKKLDGDFSKISLVGFSQGAAMSYAYALLRPERVIKLAALSGFMPRGSEEISAVRPLEGIEVLITHGRRDELVPLERADQAVGLAQMAGGKVQYCLSDVGHKLGANCFKTLKTFFQ